MDDKRTHAACRCGQVTLELTGSHIYCGVCHCDDCQAGARVIEALPGAAPMTDESGGTHCVLHRKDQYRVTKGEDLLMPYSLREGTPTRRMVATCCNTPMQMKFENSQHWVAVYLARIAKNPPRIQARFQTKFAKDRAAVPKDVPVYEGFPPLMMMKLVGAMVQKVVGR